MTSIDKTSILDRISKLAMVQDHLDNGRIWLERLKMEGLADNIRELQNTLELEISQLQAKLKG